MIDPRTLKLTDKPEGRRSIRVRVAPGEFKYWNHPDDSLPPPVVEVVTRRPGPVAPSKIARTFKR